MFAEPTARNCPSEQQRPGRKASRLPLLSLLGSALFCCALLTPPAIAGDSTLIDLSVEASHPASNDLVRAVVYAEADGNAPAVLADQINAQIAQGMRLAQSYATVRMQSGNVVTQPIRGRSGRIESWQMRQELRLESQDTGAMADLLGKLQGSLAVAWINFTPSSEARQKSENAAILAALAAFRTRAGLIAETLGRSWKIKQLNVNTGIRPMHSPQLRSAAVFAAEAAPMPLEAGETEINVSVNGQIELGDPAN